MTSEQYSMPAIISNDGQVELVERLPISHIPEGGSYNESWLQNLVFEHPQCLPIREIDQSFSDLVPICRELYTDAGYIDVLYATPQGKLVVLEAKLWRNPEARREVIGQILDYAKELSRWGYEDIQREVSKRTGHQGNALFKTVVEKYPDTDEAEFVDGITRTLKTGRFMLLIVGDGIKENVGAIASFLEQFGSLQFTFGLVEMAIYKLNGDRHLVQPRVLGKSVIFRRSVIELRDIEAEVVEEGEGQEEGEEETEKHKFYKAFWNEFLSELELDDTTQPIANPGKGENIYFPLPPSSSQAWVSVYFSKSKNIVGVYFRLGRGEFGDAAYAILEKDKDAINQGLEIPVEWGSRNGLHSVSASLQVGDVWSEQDRDKIKEFLADRVNRFINEFRPRMTRIAEDA